MRHREAEDHDLAAPDRVEHRHHVLDRALDQPTLVVGEPVRRPDAPRVEPDVTTESRQRVQEVREPRLLPHHVHAERGRARHQHVDRAAADDLVRDLPPVGRGREAGLGLFRHRVFAPAQAGSSAAMASSVSRARSMVASSSKWRTARVAASSPSWSRISSSTRCSAWRSIAEPGIPYSSRPRRRPERSSSATSGRPERRSRRRRPRAR